MLIEDVNADKSKWNVLGFLSDDAAQHGVRVGGLPVLGGAEALVRLPERPFLCFGVGSPVIKRKLAQRIRADVAGFATLLHPSVVRGHSVESGVGLIACAGSILTVDIRLGDFVTLNLACTVGHECVLGDYVTVAPGANISGNVTIGTGCDIGTGTAIVQGQEIGQWSIVGAGAVVSRSLPADCTAVGIPAKPIKTREAGWHEL